MFAVDSVKKRRQQSANFLIQFKLNQDIFQTLRSTRFFEDSLNETPQKCSLSSTNDETVSKFGFDSSPF